MLGVARPRAERELTEAEPAGGRRPGATRESLCGRAGGPSGGPDRAQQSVAGPGSGQSSQASGVAGRVGHWQSGRLTDGTRAGHAGWGRRWARLAGCSCRAVVIVTTATVWWLFSWIPARDRARMGRLPSGGSSSAVRGPTPSRHSLFESARWAAQSLCFILVHV